LSKKPNNEHLRRLKMSYDIYAINKKEEVVSVEKNNLRGGTFAIYGTKEAHYNITFNYYDQFKKVFYNGINDINNLRVVDTIQLLNNAKNKLGNDIYDNYWISSEGNAKKSLIDLIELAYMVLKVNLEARWYISK
jgi:hypothetical protein